MSNANRRTFQHVRHSSRPVGTCEAGLWRPTNAKQKHLAIAAAEIFDKAHKLKGRRNGPLGYVGIEVFRALWRAVRFRDGCLCPSIDWLQRKCRLSRAAVVAGLARLRAHGFLAWSRRLEYTGGPAGVRGPQVKQATNAYALSVPAAALALVPAGPMPDCEIARLRERAAALSTMERDAFNVSPLGAALARLGERLSPNASLPTARNPALGSIPKSVAG